MTSSFSMSSGLDGADNGAIGSLADELADAWGEEEDTSYGETSGFIETTNGDAQDARHEAQTSSEINSLHEFDFGFNSALATSQSLQSAISESPTRSSNSTLMPPPPSTTSPSKSRPSITTNHKRHESQYDGSDYGHDSDLEDSPTIPASLAIKMANIEALARQGPSLTASGDEDLIPRVTHSLHSLSAQSSIENHASRLMTAHTSLTSHLAHQTRTLHTLTHPLLFTAYGPALSEEAIDELIPLVDDLLPSLPYPPQPTPLLSLQILISNTADLAHTLRSLSDTLHESRQTTSTASRRLKSAKDLVSELQREELERETAERFIERGQWGKRLEGREAGVVCREVVEGFERVCDGFRERLVGGLVAA